MTAQDAGPAPNADASTEDDVDAAVDAAASLDAGSDAASLPNAYHGTANGFSIAVADQMVHQEGPTLLTGPLDPAKPWRSVLQVYLRDVAGTCVDYEANVRRKNSKEVEIKLTLTGATEADATLKAGTYSFSSATEADVSRVVLRARDGSCTTATPANVNVADTTKRELVIEEISSTHVKGHFAIEKGSETLAAGSFDADVCASAEPDGTSTCQ